MMDKAEMERLMGQIAGEAALKAEDDALSRKQLQIERSIELFAAEARREIHSVIAPKRLAIAGDLERIKGVKSRILKESPVAKQVATLIEERRQADLSKDGRPYRIGLFEMIDRCVRENRNDELNMYQGKLDAVDRRVRELDCMIDELRASIGLGPCEEFTGWEGNVDRVREQFRRGRVRDGAEPDLPELDAVTPQAH